MDRITRAIGGDAAPAAQTCPVSSHNEWDRRGLIEKINTERSGADSANARPHRIDGTDRQRLKGKPRNPILATMATTVPIVGNRRENPSVYLRPIAQAGSHKPAMSRKSQAMEDSPNLFNSVNALWRSCCAAAEETQCTGLDVRLP